jgi:hypothetical protein
MGGFLLALVIIAGITSLVCHILIIVKMFQTGQTGLGIACIVLTLCLGIGYLITLVVGWMNASRWGINNLMLIYTIAFVVANGAYIGAMATGNPIFNVQMPAPAH